MKFFAVARTAVLALVIIAVTSVAHATPVTYQMSSVASGQIGGISFDGAVIQLTGEGDTDNVVSFNDPSNAFSIFANPFSALTINIGGVGVAAITEPSAIWSIPDLFPGFNPVPIVVFGRIDHPPVLDSFTGIGVVGSNALSGYGLTTGIGPITGIGAFGFPTLCGTAGHDPCIQTSLGMLSFTANPEFSDFGQGTFTATLQPVPEPGSLLLMGTGLAALFGRSRLRPRP